MSRRGSYIGGHTVIGPSSGWFSKPRIKRKKTGVEKSAITNAERQKRQEIRLKEKKKRKEKARREQQLISAERAAKLAASKAARLAAWNSPEERALREQKAAERRAALELKMSKIIVQRRRLGGARAKVAGSTS
jgi:hypothetical protein